MPDTPPTASSNDDGSSPPARVVMRHEAILNEDQNFAILLVLALSLSLVLLVNIVALTFQINGFPFKPIIGIITLLFIVVWTRNTVLAAIAIIASASLVMNESLFRETYSSFASMVGMTQADGLADQVGTMGGAALPSGDADDIKRDGNLSLHAAALHELDARYLGQTVPLLMAVAAASPPPGEEAGARGANGQYLELISSSALFGMPQAEILRTSAAYLRAEGLIRCRTQTAFAEVARSADQRQSLRQDVNSCVVTDLGRALNRSLMQRARPARLRTDDPAPSQEPEYDWLDPRTITDAILDAAAAATDAGGDHYEEGVIPANGSVDISFTPRTAGVHWITVVALRGEGDPVMTVFSGTDTDRDPLEVVDDYGIEDEFSLNSFTSLSMKASDPYLIRIQDFNLEEMRYRFCIRHMPDPVEESPPFPPECEPGTVNRG